MQKLCDILTCPIQYKAEAPHYIYKNTALKSFKKKKNNQHKVEKKNVERDVLIWLFSQKWLQMIIHSLINGVLYKLLASVYLGNKPGVMKSDIDTDLCSNIHKLLLLY